MPQKKNSTSGRPDGWLARQIRIAQEDIKTWPLWMQRAARWEGALAHNTNKNNDNE